MFNEMRSMPERGAFLIAKRWLRTAFVMNLKVELLMDGQWYGRVRYRSKAIDGVPSSPTRMVSMPPSVFRSLV